MIAEINEMVSIYLIVLVSDAKLRPPPVQIFTREIVTKYTKNSHKMSILVSENKFNYI